MSGRLANLESLPDFDFEARDQRGLRVEGTLECATREQAIRYVQEQNLVLVRLRQVQAGVDFLGQVRKFVHKLGYERVGVRDLAVFTRQLALLLAAGIPLARCLEALREQIWESPYLSVVCEDLSGRILEGQRLSHAMSHHPRLFSETYIALVRAGESSGAMVEVFERLSHYLESSHRLSQKVQSALVYPSLVFTLSGVLLFFLCSYVFPLFIEFFRGMAISLPAPTVFVLGLTRVISHPAVTVLLLVLSPMAVYQGLRFSKLPKVRWQLESWALGLPVVGTFLRRLYSARFCRTAAILLECGLGQMQTLELLRQVSGSLVVAAQVEVIRENLRDGRGTLSSELLLTEFFPSICGHMVYAAEESGKIPEMFARLADFFDEAVETGLQALLACIEPVMMLVMGVIVATVLLSVFHPIYALLEKL
jgi:type IV pilus assembly protein PilC